jgi:hypothetical protein
LPDVITAPDPGLNGLYGTLKGIPPDTVPLVPDTLAKFVESGCCAVFPVGIIETLSEIPNSFFFC